MYGLYQVEIMVQFIVPNCRHVYEPRSTYYTIYQINNSVKDRHLPAFEMLRCIQKVDFYRLTKNAYLHLLPSYRLNKKF